VFARRQAQPGAGAAAIATAGAIVIAVLGSLVPLSQIGRLSPHAVLAAE
jgi:hypothetical protein